MYRKTSNSSNSAGCESKKKIKNSLKHSKQQHIISSTTSSTSSSSSSFYNNNNNHNHHHYNHKNKHNNNNNHNSCNKVIHQNIKMYVNNLYNNSSSDFMQLSNTTKPQQTPSVTTTSHSDSTRSCTSSTDSITSASSTTAASSTASLSHHHNQNQHQHLHHQSATCSSAKNELNNLMGLNNFNSMTTAAAASHTAAASPGTYSLDFLHYVGEQITSGRTNFHTACKTLNDDHNNNHNHHNNNNINTISHNNSGGGHHPNKISSSNSSSKIMTTTESVAVAMSVPVALKTKSSLINQQQPQQFYIDTPPHINSSNHHLHSSSAAALTNNNTSAGNSNINSNSSNHSSNNNNSNNNNYRFNQHGGNYHHNNNYHTFNRNFNPHHSSGGGGGCGHGQGKHRSGGGTNWNNNISNAGGMSIMNNGGGWQSKNHKNYNSNNKNIATNQNTSKTVLYSRSNRIINSRSPTPSPKSESPPIEISTTASSVNCAAAATSALNKMKTTGRPIDEIVNYNMNAIHHHHHQPSPHTNGGGGSANNFNGYDTDSSVMYSSNGHSMNSINSSNSTSNHNNGPHIIELPISLSHIHDEPFRGYYTFYGSHQNLNQLYEPNFMHKHNYSSSSSDTGLNFLTDHLDGGFAPTDSVINCSGGGGNNISSSKKKNLPAGLSHSNGVVTAGGKFSRTGKKINNTGYTIKGASSEFIHTPPDRFLAKSHLIQTKVPHKDLIVGSEWDSISQNIWDRFIGAQQTEETFKRKMYLWRYLFLSIKKAFPRYGLYLVGSTITGFGTDNSDVDMCLVTRYVTHNDPRIEALFYLTELKNYLMNTSGIFENFHLIQAKVPILRFKDTFNALEVDLNFNNCVGIRNTHLLYCYQQMDWRLKPLAVIVKLWAQFHHINNAKNMTISSYSLVLMVIHFLQVGVCPPVLPCLHALYPEKFQKILDLSNIDMIESMKPYASDNRQTVGELFYRFLEYYSNFDYAQYAISVRTASILPIEECRQARSYKNDPHQWKQLCIEEPFDLTNTARSVYDGEIFEKIKNVFITSYKVLHETMELNSVFTTVYLATTALTAIPTTLSSSSMSQQSQIGNPMTQLITIPSSLSASSPSIAINAGTGCL